MKIAKIIFIFIFSVFFLPSASLAIYIEGSVDGSTAVDPNSGEKVEIMLLTTDLDETVSSDDEFRKKNGQDNTNMQIQVQAQVQDREQIHESGTGLENPELKEMNQEQNQEQNQLQINKDDKTTNSKNENGNSRSLERRSEVANAVQELLGVAERNEGIGEQIREIAKNQNQNQNNIENSLEKVQNRNKFLRFLVGPNYKELKQVEKNIDKQNQEVSILENLVSETIDEDKILLENKISEIKAVVEDTNQELTKNKKVFSLFGWLSNLFTK